MEKKPKHIVSEKDSPHGFKPNLKLKDLEKKWKYQTKLTEVSLLSSHD